MNIVHKPICKCVTTCRYWSRLKVRPRQQQRIKARPLLQLMTSVNPEARRSLKSILPPNKRESVEAFSARSLPCFGLSRLLVHDNSLLGTQRALEESCDAKGKKRWDRADRQVFVKYGPVCMFTGPLHYVVMLYNNSSLPDWKNRSRVNSNENLGQRRLRTKGQGVETMGYVREQNMRPWLSTVPGVVFIPWRLINMNALHRFAYSWTLTRICMSFIYSRHCRRRRSLMIHSVIVVVVGWLVVKLGLIVIWSYFLLILWFVQSLRFLIAKLNWPLKSELNPQPRICELLFKVCPSTTINGNVFITLTRWV